MNIDNPKVMGSVYMPLSNWKFVRDQAYKKRLSANKYISGLILKEKELVKK